MKKNVPEAVLLANKIIHFIRENKSVDFLEGYLVDFRDHYKEGDIAKEIDKKTDNPE